MSAALEPQDFTALYPVSCETLERLSAYAAILGEWSLRFNLVGRESLADLWRRHILDSAQLVPLLPPSCRSLIDLGSGAGLPGLVLAILGVPGVELVEADSRKCAFLFEAARVAGAAVRIHDTRIEAMPPMPFDIVTARALAPLHRLLPLAARFEGPQTRFLFLKGERAREELTRARKAWTMTLACHKSRSDPRGVILELRQVFRHA